MKKVFAAAALCTGVTGKKKLKSHKHGRQDFPVVFVRRRLMEDILPGKKNPPAGEPPI